MAQAISNRSRVVAVLGPTNTGKTHFAVERMLAHRSGMIGFPLRLLAREIYDRIVALRGRQAVRLITGEEKLGPETAPYVVATVEAMPIDRAVDFLAVDEIQLCADFERGHIFTDRLLKARGREETMFLGSDTVRPVLKRLIPDAEVITRPRFSILRHAGGKKLHRLPRRSAIVAFTAAEVYTLAEIIRRQKGGAAVVLGALSPRTRNAQVELYQSGEVDHLVATDAIGMGLNMDVAHVAFASLDKFDGREKRRLRVPEIAQIAGRAGRHMSDGTFGTTNGCAVLDEKEIEAVEGHAFPPLKALRWRNSDLDFTSLDHLIASLDAPPFAECLIRVHDALDDRSLVLLAQRPEIRARADRPERVRLLWQVCQIPDYRKTLTDAHLHLLATVFKHVTTGNGTLPSDWVGAMIARLDRTDGDIDTLVGRIAHIRTWTFLSHRADWLEDPLHWQGRAREVEDRLSDALHERLTQRFVDRRTASLMRSLRATGELPAEIDPGGEVVVDGHLVGRLEGLSFTLASSEAESERKVLAAAARRVIGPELLRRVKRLAQAGDEAFALDRRDRIAWEGAAVARLVGGADPLAPRIVPIAGDELAPSALATVADRVRRWFAGWLEARLGPLFGLVEASRSPRLGGAARGVAYRLVERLGSAPRDECADLLAQMDQGDRRELTRLGVRFGRHWLYVPQLLRPVALEARALLLRLDGADRLATPPAGRTVLRGEEVPSPEAAAIALGFAPFAGFALRQDAAERLAAGLRARARENVGFALPAELAAEAGLNRAELALLMEDLGFRKREESGTVLYAPGERRRHARRPDRQRADRLAQSPFAALVALKSVP